MMLLALELPNYLCVPYRALGVDPVPSRLGVPSTVEQVLQYGKETGSFTGVVSVFTRPRVLYIVNLKLRPSSFEHFRVLSPIKSRYPMKQIKADIQTRLFLTILRGCTTFGQSTRSHMFKADTGTKAGNAVLPDTIAPRPVDGQTD